MLPLHPRRRVTDAGNRLRCIFKRALALASPTRSTSSHRVSRSEEERRRVAGHTPNGRGGVVSAEPQDQMETISLQGQERVAGACTNRQEITQPPDFMGWRVGLGKEGNAQRAVDLSSLERHAHTSCVLIIPGLRIKKYCLARRARERTNARAIGGGEDSWGAGVRRSN